MSALAKWHLISPTQAVKNKVLIIYGSLGLLGWKSYWKTGLRLTTLINMCCSRAAARGERWARRIFSSDEQVHPLLLRGWWAAPIELLHGKAFYLMRVKRGGERVKTFFMDLLSSLIEKIMLQQRKCLLSLWVDESIYHLHDWEFSLLLLYYCIFSTVCSSAWNSIYCTPFLTFPVNSRLQIWTSMMLSYVTDILSTRLWPCGKDEMQFATCGLWCQRDRVWPIQQNEQHGSGSRSPLSLPLFSDDSSCQACFCQSLPEGNNAMWG